MFAVRLLTRGKSGVLQLSVCFCRSACVQFYLGLLWCRASQQQRRRRKNCRVKNSDAARGCASPLSSPADPIGTEPPSFRQANGCTSISFSSDSTCFNSLFSQCHLLFQLYRASPQNLIVLSCRQFFQSFPPLQGERASAFISCGVIMASHHYTLHIFHE